MTAPTILVVDDEPDILTTFRVILERGLPGAKVLTATNGADGLGLLGRYRVDVVLSDYRMRGLDGLAFLQRVHAAAPQARCVLVTAYPASAFPPGQLRQLGVTALLPKPCRAEQLVRAVGDPGAAAGPGSPAGGPVTPRSAAPGAREPGSGPGPGPRPGASAR